MTKAKDKFIVVVSGKPQSGKDTFCDIVTSEYNGLNYSSIDPIKAMARTCLGWNGEKTDEARKMLSDLKRVATEYNDLPNNYMLAKTREFIESDSGVLFLHIREAQEIFKYLESVNNLDPTLKVVTLLVKRFESAKKVYGNESDDQSEAFGAFDYVYYNNKSLIEMKQDVLTFFADMYEKERMKAFPHEW